MGYGRESQISAIFSNPESLTQRWGLLLARAVECGLASAGGLSARSLCLPCSPPVKPHPRGRGEAVDGGVYWGSGWRHQACTSDLTAMYLGEETPRLSIYPAP